jgi:hypothetical protein
MIRSIVSSSIRHRAEMDCRPTSWHTALVAAILASLAVSLKERPVMDDLDFLITARATTKRLTIIIH